MISKYPLYPLFLFEFFLGYRLINLSRLFFVLMPLPVFPIPPCRGFNFPNLIIKHFVKCWLMCWQNDTEVHCTELNFEIHAADKKSLAWKKTPSADHIILLFLPICSNLHLWTLKANAKHRKKQVKAVMFQTRDDEKLWKKMLASSVTGAVPVLLYISEA